MPRIETMAQEERLKQELENIKRQIEEAEVRNRSTRGDTTVAKKELQDLLAYKQQKVLNDDPTILDRELLDLEREIQRQRDAMKQLDRVMQGLREQKDLLDTHLADSESELRESRRDVENQRGR